MVFDTDDYDEFGMLGDNAAEAGLALTAPPPVTRTTVTVADGQTVSALAWGDAEPELVLLHGGGQNAHTWDTVALALGRPLLAVDLPGHGHSGRRGDRDYGPWRNAEAVAAVIEQAAPAARAVVGMSLGGATAIRLAATRPDLVRRAVIVDVTPQQRRPLARSAARRTRGGGPGQRPPGVRVVRGDGGRGGRREPRPAPRRRSSAGSGTTPGGCPTGAGPGGTTCSASARRRSATTPGCGRTCPPSRCRCCWCSVPIRSSPASDDVAEFRRRLPAARVEVVAGAGHAVQSDQPLALARLIDDFTAVESAN